MQTAYLLLALASTATYATVDPLADLLVQFQWKRSSRHETSPCVAIDAYVRVYAKNALLVLLTGICAGIDKGATYCSIAPTRSFPSRPTPLTVPARVTQASLSDTRSGTVRPFLLESREPARLLWYNFIVDCGTVDESGSVKISFNSTEIPGITFSKSENLPPSIPISTAGVCTRLFALSAWTSKQTVLFVEWLEWQFALGVPTVHVYLHNLHNPDMRSLLASYARAGRVVVYSWTDSSNDDAVRHGWALAQIAHIADCFLRLEGRVQYMAALDHDEFLQPGVGSTMPHSLDAFYAKSPSSSRIIRIYPFSIYPIVCSANETNFRVLSFCRGEATAYKRFKYIVRCDPARPIILFPGIHEASDGTEPAVATAATLRIFHIVQFKKPNLAVLQETPSWNHQTLTRAYEKFLDVDKSIQQIYSKARQNSRASADKLQAASATASDACFHFFDGGANIGDSLQKAANPIAHPTSGLARLMATIDRSRFECQKFWAFEGNPAFDRKLEHTCTALGWQNIDCTVMGGILSNTNGTTTFYLDTDSAPINNQWGSSVFAVNAHSNKSTGKASTVQVRTFEFVEILFQKVRLQDYVVVKLDIEGSEYAVLDSLIRDIRVPCTLIDLVLIEWHTKSLGAAVQEQLERKFNKTLEQEQSYIKSNLRACGVDVRDADRVTD